MPLIRMAYDAFAEVERRLKYRFWDKERERSNHAVQIAAGGPTRPSCPHQRIAWSGPPHDLIQAITCLDCGSFATEPEMRDRGFDFENCPDWVFFKIFDERASQKFSQGNPKTFFLNQR